MMRVWKTAGRAFSPPSNRFSDTDLERTVLIRGEPHSVMQAINRQIAHYAYHCGQIVFLAKHLKGAEWKTLSVPRNKSAEFNQRCLREKQVRDRDLRR